MGNRLNRELEDLKTSLQLRASVNLKTFAVGLLELAK